MCCSLILKLGCITDYPTETREDASVCGILAMYVRVCCHMVLCCADLYVCLYTLAALHCRQLHQTADSEQRGSCSDPPLQGTTSGQTQRKRHEDHGAWRPTKRLLWHQIEHLRNMRQEDPKEWTHVKLAKQFGISVPAVTRILKSKCVCSCV